eukprot:21808_6
MHMPGPWYRPEPSSRACWALIGAHCSWLLSKSVSDESSAKMFGGRADNWLLDKKSCSDESSAKMFGGRANNQLSVS